ncbi:MAG: cyclic nucleotide-binding domain-containing protein [Telmatospirillum sp.]|nr:cyclic nucleotide-binding domain-containing protein [Telmatospirillum sp.]
MPDSPSPFKFAKEKVWQARDANGNVRDVKVVQGRAQQRWTFEAQKAIFFEGQPGDAAYLIESGEVAIVKNAPPGSAAKHVPIARLKAGDVFGEMALIDGRNRSASAIAIGKVVVLVIEASDFERELDGAGPTVADALNIMLAYIRAVPPRDMWIDGKMPVLSGEISREKVSQVLAEASGHFAKIENEFLLALYRKLADYVMARMPKMGA